MTEESGALPGGKYDGKSLLLELISAPECNSLVVTISEFNEYLFISGFEIFRFNTEDKIRDFISNIGNNIVVYAPALAKKGTYFLCDPYEFIRTEKIQEGTLVGPLDPEPCSLNSTNDSVDAFDYHVLKCGEIMPIKMRIDGFDSLYKDDDDEMGLEQEDEMVGENELEYYDGTNEIVECSQSEMYCLFWKS